MDLKRNKWLRADGEIVDNSHWSLVVKLPNTVSLLGHLSPSTVVGTVGYIRKRDDDATVVSHVRSSTHAL